MRVKLGEVFDLQMGKTPARNNPDYWNGDNAWVSISDLGNAEKYIDRTKEKITDKGVKESGIKIVPKGTVIMSFKLSIGKTAITAGDMYTNEAIMAFLDKKICEMDTDYLYHLFSGFDWSAGTNKAVMGLTLNKATLSKKEIPLPPITEQRKIAAVLDKVCELISLRHKQLERLDLMVKARFVEMFGDTIKNTYGWNQQYLSDITLKIGSGATPKGGKESYCLDGITFIRSMNVYDGRFEYKDLAYINEAQAKSLNNVIVCKNDVFINITGASVARSCIVPDEVLPARVNQHVAIIRCMEKEINPIFLNNMFINENFKKHLLAIGESGGATRQAITKQQLESLFIIVPPLDLQEGFASFVTEIDKLKLPIRRSLDTLEVLKKSLMQEYFGQGV